MEKLRREFFPRHGYCDILITDRGQEFQSAEFNDYLKSVGVKHHRTTPYNPQSNGKTERFNKTFKSMISKLINNKRDDWEEQIGAALTAYNNSTSTVTGHTPFFLLYGRRARLPLHRMLDPHSALEGRLQDLSEAWKAARAMTEESRRYNRERLAKKANTGELELGDSVIIKAQAHLTNTSRWDPHWLVTQIRGKTIYLRHIPTGQTKTLNQNKVQLVDPDINWDEVNPRPIRQTNVSTKFIGVRPHMQTHCIRTTLTDENERTLATEQPAVPVGNDQLNRRSRHFLPRAAKCHRVASPTPIEQKRARLEAIACVQAICW